MSTDEWFLEEPFRSLWAGEDPFVAVEALEGQVFRELDGRRTLRSEVAGRGYFVKIHRGIGWGEIFKNLLSLRWPVLGAQNEWRAIRRLQELGIDSMHAVAFGRRGRNPARQHSFDPKPTPESFRLSLIDLHRAQLRARTPRRWRDKDLAALYFSVLDIGLTKRDLLRFLAAYFVRPLRLLLREEAPLLASLASEQQRLQTRFARKSAAGEMT